MPKKTPVRERGASIAQAIHAMKVLLHNPRRPADLVDDLECSRRSVHRLLNAFNAAGLKLEVEHSGRDAFYRLPRETLRKQLGL